MVELDLSFVSFLALALVLGFLAGYSIRGLRRRRIEDMLLFFRQRDQEQDRKIALLERDVSDARGRVLALRADQSKSEKIADDLRAALEKAQLEAARLREELSAATTTPSSDAAKTEPAAEESAPEDQAEFAPEDDSEGEAAEVQAAEKETSSAAVEDALPVPAEAMPAATASPAKSQPARGPAPNKKRPKRGRLP